MTGKLNLAYQDGSYGAYWRRAKAVAEVADYIRKNGALADGSAVPAAVLTGDILAVTWSTALGGFGDTTSYTAGADQTDQDALEGLAAAVRVKDGIYNAQPLNGDLAMIPTQPAGQLTTGAIVYTPFTP